MKKSISVLLAAVLVFALLIPALVTMPAAAEIDPIQIEISQEEGVQAIYDALNEAHMDASESTPYEIFVGPGNYTMRTGFHIFSNTSLIADKNAHFKLSASDNMLKVGTTGSDPMSGYGYENIKVVGGDWDANNFVATMFKFCHAKNCVLYNVNAHNLKDAHFVEVAGVDGIDIVDCKFYDMHVAAQNRGREAIQIDVLHADHIAGYEHLNDEIDYLCKNIYISGCEFTGVSRAIASHTVVQGKYFENVDIIGNKFNNTDEKSILCFNMKELVIKDNVINGNDVGIEIKTMDSAGSGTYLSYNDRSYDNKANPVHLAAEVYNNTVISKNNHAILVNGVKLTKAVEPKYDTVNKIWTNDRVPAGDYYVEGVTIHDNTLTAYAKMCAIKLKYARNCSVQQNTVTGASTAESPIYVCDGSTKTEIINNTILSSVLNGIRVCNFNAEATYPQGNISLISGNSVAAVKENGYGINVSDALVGAIDNNTVEKSANLGIQLYKNVEAVTVNSICGNVIKSARIGIKSVNAKAGNMNNNQIGATTSNSIHIDEKSVVVMLNNNTITNAGESAIVLRNSTITDIADNIITAPKGMGIYACDGAVIKGTISGNTIMSAGTNGICTNKVNVKNSITANTISAPKAMGIYCYGGGTVQSISENIIKNTGSNGICTNGVNVKSIDKNKISACGEMGIYCYTGGTVDAITNNTLNTTNSNGICINHVTIKNISTNAISSCKGMGIYSYSGASINTISSNTIKSTTGNAICANNAVIGNLVKNTIITCNGMGIFCYSGSKVGKISANTVSNAKGNAICTSKATVTGIDSNKISTCGGMGIYCYNGGSVGKISANVISGAKNNGICVNTVVIKSLDSNKISGCKGIGIYINGHSTKTQVNAVKSNTITSCVNSIKIIKGSKVNLYVNAASKNTGGNAYVINGAKQYKLGNVAAVTPVAKKYGKTALVGWTKKGTVTGYMLYRSTSATSGFAKIATAKGTAKSFIDKTVKAKKTYYYRTLPYLSVPGSYVVIYGNAAQSKAVKM